MAETKLHPLAQRFVDFVIERPKTALLVAMGLLSIVVPGATPGMRAWRVRLIGPDGAHPGAAACVLRFGVAMLSGLALGGGFFWALFDARRRCWHDLASGSELIVEKRRSGRTP